MRWPQREHLMRALTLYLDTSVIGGYHDSEWMAETRLLWRQAEAGQWRLVTSIVAEAELKNAPANVREIFAETFGASSILDMSVEIEELAQSYLAVAVVTASFADRRISGRQGSSGDNLSRPTASKLLSRAKKTGAKIIDVRPFLGI